MIANRTDLPSLSALRTFEAAARQESFKLAAGELNVTAGAISRQIKSLEHELGTAVFERRHRRVVLTAAGRELYLTLARSFGEIARCIDGIRTELTGQHVTIGTTLAFAHYWLVPRIGSFWNQHDTVIDQVNSDRDAELQTTRLDFCVRYGSGGWFQEDGERLFGDILYPVAAPALVGSAGQQWSLPALAHLTLIDVVGVNRAWTRWAEFLARAGADWPIRKHRQVTNYIIAVEAAKSGQGVVIGWHRLVGPLVANGQLVPVTGVSLPATGAYFLNWRQGQQHTTGAQAVRAWLTATAHEEAATDVPPNTAPDPRG